MDCSLPVSSVHGILQARILEWVAISFSTIKPDVKIYFLTWGGIGGYISEKDAKRKEYEVGNRGTLSPKSKCQGSGGDDCGIHGQTRPRECPAPLPVRLVTLVKLPHFSMCQFPQLYNRNGNNHTYLRGWL